MRRSILAHRGLWEQDAEKNMLASLARAVRSGYGIETDVRDCRGQLVIAHDMPVGIEVAFADIVRLCAETRVPLAINVKADGLAVAIGDVLHRHPDLDAFCFDMSVPELFRYQMQGLPTFTRVSEFETAPVLYDKAEGVWLDAFDSDWYAPDLIKRFIGNGKRVAVVSPELHHRQCQDLWASLLSAGLGGSLDDLLLCTDYPEAAVAFFGDKA